MFLNEHNSVAEARLGGKDQYYNNNFQGSAFFEYKIIDGLTLKGNAAATFNSNNQHKFAKSINYYSADSEDPIKTTRSQAIDFEKKSWEVNLQAYLNYSKTFGKHGVGALLGYSQLYNQYRQFGASRRDLPGNNNLGEVNAGDVTTQSNEGTMIGMPCVLPSDVSTILSTTAICLKQTCVMTGRHVFPRITVWCFPFFLCRMENLGREFLPCQLDG